VLVSAALPQQGISNETQRTLSGLLAELPLKQAVQLAVQITGEGRKELYQLALQLKESEEQ
jgi:16S rRNA (cytidine1402-2'-O)-methyltransferase